MRRYFKGRRRQNRWFHRGEGKKRLTYYQGRAGRFYRYDDGRLVQVAGPFKPMRTYSKT